MTGPSDVLTPGAKALINDAMTRGKEAGDKERGLNLWLVVLLERYGPLAQKIARDLDAASCAKNLRAKLTRGEHGVPLSVEEASARAVGHARARGNEKASERDLAAVLLEMAGYELRAEGTTTPTTSPGQGVTAKAAQPRPQTQPPAQASHALRPTPTLEEFGRDLTEDARKGKLAPVVGRDVETQALVETLCRRTKRNPLLIGPAGVGKTAIVEGFAQRAARGDVPPALQGVRVFALQPSVLVAGAHLAGEFENRLKSCLAEARQPGVILFIDEVHTLMGTGGRLGTGDAASIVKPELARGELACIAATTDEEYRLWIQNDAALERRFQPVRVQALSAQETVEVVKTLRDELQQLRGVVVSDRVVAWMVEFAREHMPNRYFPDKAIDLLEQTVAHAATEGLGEVTFAVAELVVERMVGMPQRVDQRLIDLRQALRDQTLLAEEDIETLVDRLAVTTHGLDVHPARPNAVILLAGRAAEIAPQLAAEERQVTINLGRMTEAHDITMLVGSAPGYVGYSQKLPIHDVAQMPWCVLTLQNIDGCHPQIAEVVAVALSDGFITDGTGKRIYLSDATVILTAPSLETDSVRAFGFSAGTDSKEGPASVDAARLSKVVGNALAEQCDIVITHIGIGTKPAEAKLGDITLEQLHERCRSRGLEIQWEDEALEWLADMRRSCECPRSWERFLEDKVLVHLTPYLPETPEESVVCVVRRSEDGEMIIERVDRSKEADDRPSVLVMVGSALAIVSVCPWGDDDATITTRAYVLFGAELTQELLHDLLLRNDSMRFGAFGVDKDGDIFFEHTIVGSTCDRDELKASVLAVGITADRAGPELAASYGGQTAAQRAGMD